MGLTRIGALHLVRRTGCRHAAVMMAMLGAASATQAQAHAQPGDKVYIHIWDSLPQSQDTLTVDAQGRITLPKRGPMGISQYPASVVPDSIRAWMHQSYTSDVAIDAVVLRRVTVLGEARTPNVFYIESWASIRDVIARASGITDNADVRKVSLVRDGVTTLMPAWNTGGAPTELLSGDLIIVGRKSWFLTNGLQVASFGVAFASLMFSLLRR